MKRRTFLLLLCLVSVVFSLISFPAVAAPSAYSSHISDASDMGSRYSSSRDDWWAEAQAPVTLRDSYVMPDYDNTGHVTPREDLVDFAVKYPDVTCRKNTYSADYVTVTYVINDTIAKKYNYTFEGFRIDVGCLSCSGLTKPVLFRDFYINATDDHSTAVSTALRTTQGRVYLMDGELEGSYSAIVSGFNITMIRCYLHDCWADHVKGFSGQTFLGCYFTTGGLNGGNPHPDIVQFTGNNGLSTDHVYYYGNRFDATITSVNSLNCCIILQSEFGGGCSDIRVSRNWFNGGGTLMQIGAKDQNHVGGPAYYRDVSFTDNYFGNGSRWNNYLYFTADSAYPHIKQNTEKEGNVVLSGPQVGSLIWQSDGKRVFHAGDMTGDERTLAVSLSNYIFYPAPVRISVRALSSDGTALGTVTHDVTLPAGKSYSAYSSDPDLWKTFRYSDQPFDIPVTVDLSALPAQAGVTYVAEVFYLRSNQATEVLRTETLTPAGGAPDYETLLPEGTRFYDENALSPNRLFVAEIDKAQTLYADALRGSLVRASEYYAQADDEVYGVTEAKEEFFKLVEKYNEQAARDNAWREEGLAVARETVPGTKSLFRRIWDTLIAWLRGLFRAAGKEARV